MSMAAEFGLDFNTGLHAIEIGALIWVGVWRLGGMAESVQALQKAHVKLESSIETLAQLRINDASDRERLNAIDQRMIMTGQRYDDSIKQILERINHVSQRNDTIANVLNGRLEAINNIVAGHTARLERISERD